MKKFKNCPCCSSSNIYLTFEVNDIGTTIPVMFCNSCKIIFKVENDSPYLNDKATYKYLEEKTIKAWNTRKSLERVIERLEELTEKYMSNSEKAAELGMDYEKHMIYNCAKGNAFEETIEIIKQEMM